MTSSLTLQTTAPADTQEVGRLLGELAQPGDLFLLTGDLGAGKTTLTQGIAWGLGVKEYARSPTFVLVNEYMGRLPIYHIDLYRLDNPAEALDIGLEEYVAGNGVTVIEWAEKALGVLPPEHLRIELVSQDDDEQRAIHFEAWGDRYRELLAQLEATARTRGLGGLRAPGH